LLERGLEGKFVLVKNRELSGSYDSDVSAYSEGLKKFGNVPLLIVQVSKDEPTAYIPALMLGLA